jgi:hypothetical protein
LCFGGMDIWVRCGKRKYALREALETRPTGQANSRR